MRVSNPDLSAWHSHSDAVNTNLIIRFIVMLVLSLKVMREMGKSSGNSRFCLWVLRRTFGVEGQVLGRWTNACQMVDHPLVSRGGLPLVSHSLFDTYPILLDSVSF